MRTPESAGVLQPKVSVDNGVDILRSSRITSFAPDVVAALMSPISTRSLDTSTLRNNWSRRLAMINEHRSSIRVRYLADRPNEARLLGGYLRYTSAEVVYVLFGIFALFRSVFPFWQPGKIIALRATVNCLTARRSGVRTADEKWLPRYLRIHDIPTAGRRTSRQNWCYPARLA